ncbi:response regulator [Algimonas porphyrae]|uniref:Response regulatory domain-containing protein n=1 Tax=Algimonas porphyrae TaxID=1128113 RepID=A0ABQ5V2S9_9PROT|nr:response regulator [Algimonas porphyrae]GLQ21158.1 hypothetical protein GCM10007854_21130 [Algimonas porphyrae]
MNDVKDRSKRVIIVEDDALIALDIEDILLGAGLDVIGCFHTVSAAMDQIDRDVPDLALLDYNLGSETSIPIAERLKELNVPFLFISGQTQRVVLSDMKTTHKVIGKPFQPKRLVSEVISMTSER